MLWRQLRYFGAKIQRAWSEGKKAGRFFLSAVRVPWEATLGYWRLAAADRRLDVAAGFGDHRGRAGHHRSDPEHLRRILAAYRAAKQAQAAAPPAFAIRGLWAEWIDVNFRDLLCALNAGEVSRLAALLENLHREPFTRGAGSSFDEYLRYRTSVTGRLYVRTVWCRYRDRFRSLAPGAGEIHSPLVGNPAGLPSDGEVIPIHAFRYAYHAREMAEWLKDTPGAVIAEIGGGIGAQAYQVLQSPAASPAKYLLFDIPEMAAVSSYFLLSALPEKRIRLFGEGPVSTAAGADYDVAVLPHFAIVELAADSVDLFHNSCSFSEMDRASTRACLQVIERACRRYFSHINHEVRLRYCYRDGSTSENLIGSEVVPDPQRFRRIFQKPRVFCLPEDRPYPTYEYLYERFQGLPQPGP